MLRKIKIVVVGECQMNKAKKFLIFPNLVNLNIISKIITKDPLLSLVQD